MTFVETFASVTTLAILTGIASVWYKRDLRFLPLGFFFVVITGGFLVFAMALSLGYQFGMSHQWRYDSQAASSAQNKLEEIQLKALNGKIDTQEELREVVSIFPHGPEFPAGLPPVPLWFWICNIALLVESLFLLAASGSAYKISLSISRQPVPQSTPGDSSQ
jgi:hypothetical protein